MTRRVYLLTNEAFWEADIASGSERIYSSNDKSFAGCLFPRHVGHGAKTIQFASVQERLRERRGKPKKSGRDNEIFWAHDTTLDVKAQWLDHSRRPAARCQ
jgi:hypothetical protein